MKFAGALFEGTLWNSCDVIFAAVIGSLLAGFTIFYMATVDMVYLVMHTLEHGAKGSEELLDEQGKY